MEARGLIEKYQNATCRKILSEELKLGLTAALMEYAISYGDGRDDDSLGCLDDNAKKAVANVAPASKSVLQKIAGAVKTEVERVTIRKVVTGMFTGGYIVLGMCAARFLDKWELTM